MSGCGDADADAVGASLLIDSFFVGRSAVKDEQALEPHDLRRQPPRRHPGEGGGGSVLQGGEFFNCLIDSLLPY